MLGKQGARQMVIYVGVVHLITKENVVQREAQEDSAPEVWKTFREELQSLRARLAQAWSHHGVRRVGSLCATASYCSGHFIPLEVVTTTS